MKPTWRRRGVSWGRGRRKEREIQELEARIDLISGKVSAIEVILVRKKATEVPICQVSPMNMVPLVLLILLMLLVVLVALVAKLDQMVDGAGWS